MKTYFHISYDEKDAAKQLGAWWDKEANAWFAPTPIVAQKMVNAGWAIIECPTPITVLPGEDRLFGGNSLFVDLVPRSCWFTNVRYCIDPSDWKRLSLGIRKRSGNVCEICGAVPNYKENIHLEAHERWDFVEDGRQVLKRIVSLCKLCHQTTHWGLAQLQGFEDVVRAHLMKVNDWDERQTLLHVNRAFDDWQERSERSWDLDLSIIEDAAIRIVRPVAKSERQAVVDENFQ